MKIQPLTEKLSNISKKTTLRCDPKYCHFWDFEKGTPIKTDLKTTFLKHFTVPYEKKMISKGTLDEERPIIELNDVESRTSIVLYDKNGNPRVTSEIESSKLDFEDCDIVFNRLEPYLGKILINDHSQNTIGTSEWIPLKFKPRRINKLFIKYLLLTPSLLNAYWELRSGKRHARIREWDLVRIWLPIPDIDLQNRMADKIKPLEQEMIAKLRTLKKPVDVINGIFSERFGFDCEEYRTLSNIHQFIRHPVDTTRTVEFRMTAKFQHPRYEYLQRILKCFETVKLRTLCSTPINRGVQPLYDPDGETYVVKTLNLQHSHLDFAEADFVNRAFYDEHKDAQVHEDDILISSTGEGRGKVDIYKEESEAIADSHISIVRVKESVNPQFIVYYLRSLIGKMILELSEIAIKGTPEIYSYMLEKAPIIVVDREMQDNIVEKVEIELKEIQRQRKSIGTIRDEIDDIILTPLSGQGTEPCST